MLLAPARTVASLSFNLLTFFPFQSLPLFSLSLPFLDIFFISSIPSPTALLISILSSLACNFFLFFQTLSFHFHSFHPFIACLYFLSQPSFTSFFFFSSFHPSSFCFHSFILSLSTLTSIFPVLNFVFNIVSSPSFFTYLYFLSLHCFKSSLFSFPSFAYLYVVYSLHDFHFSLLFFLTRSPILDRNMPIMCNSSRPM